MNNFPKKMLLRNAHWILLAVCLLLVYVFYTSSDESPTGVPNSNNGKSKESSRSLTESKSANDENGGNSIYARLQALKPRLLPIMSKFSYKASDNHNSDDPNADAPQTIRGKKPISPLIMGKNHTRLKTILYWNEFYGRFDTYDFGFGQEAFQEKSCAFSNCFTTKDRNLLPMEEYDAIIIHIRGLPNDWPKTRSVNQRYVMLSIDAPVRLYEYRRLERLSFNYTMTYRSDSTFPIPYARIERSMPLPAPIGSSQLDRYIKYFGQKAAKAAPGNGNMAEGKVGLAVQFVSNCRTYSRLEAYVRELRRYVPVDIYGKCGEFKCSGDKSDVKESNGITRGDKSSSVKTIISNSNKQGAWDCHQQVATKYKFFLAFEDSFCKDFVTEKFFSMFNGDLDMVPVVLGGGNYSAIAPPNSYIDASKFQSPKALAHHLKLLDADDAKYNSYFWWRKFYRRRFNHHQSMCDLCEKLHTDKTPSVYPNMRDWWVDQAKCSTKTIHSQDDMI